MSARFKDFLFAQEFITDAQGHIRKVIIDIANY